MPNYQGVWSLSTQYQNRTGWPVNNTANGIAIVSNASGMQTFVVITLGNSTDFGDFTTQRGKGAGFASTVRGVVGGGSGPVNIIDFITFLTEGNATDFGDLTVAREECAGHSSSTRGLIAGGDTGSKSDVIDYVTIHLSLSIVGFLLKSRIPALKILTFWRTIWCHKCFDMTSDVLVIL